MNKFEDGGIGCNTDCKDEISTKKNEFVKEFNFMKTIFRENSLKSLFSKKNGNNFDL